MSTTPQPIGNMSLIGRTKEVLSTKLGFVMATEMENIKKRHPQKDVQRNADVTKRRFSAASSASARCSKKVEAAGTPDPNEVSGRYSPERGCHEVTGVEIIAKKKLGCQPSFPL